MPVRHLAQAALLTGALAATAGTAAASPPPVLGQHQDPGAGSSTVPLHPELLGGAQPRALAALGASRAQIASTRQKPAQLPVITAVTPLRVAVGQRLHIRGKHFRSGRGRDTVVFLASNQPAVFVRAERATTTLIIVKVPAKIGQYLSKRGGKAVATRFRLRVLTTRFGPSFTPRGTSPTIVPSTTPVKPAHVCDPRTGDGGPNADGDHDGLINSLEVKIHTNPCLPDTDGDGVTDGYEYQSALDLNSRALPYPGKRPYPNPLDPSDANTDYDGDSLTLAEEYTAWVKYGHSQFPLNYSDGTQTTGGPVQDTAANAWQDENGNGFLSDDEKDIDNDHLTNYDEQHGPLLGQAWWTAVWGDSEKPYKTTFAGTDWLDPDTDGDGVKDGADDQDHDGWTNYEEVFRVAYRGVGTNFWIQPFNPCLPDPNSPTCSLHPPVKDSWPPFDRPIPPGDQPPYHWPL